MALHRQTGFAFLAEAAPFSAVPVGTTLNPVVKADALETIEKVAVAYDYSVEQKGKIFCLKKRFSDPRDLPCVTIADCRAAIQEIAKDMRLFNPRLNGKMVGDTSAKIADFDAALTTAQRQQLGEGLALSTLSEPQKRAIFNLCLNLYVEQNIDPFATAAAWLNRAEEEGFLEYYAQSTGRILCFEVPLLYDRTARVPILRIQMPFRQDTEFNRFVKQPFQTAARMDATRNLCEVVEDLNKKPLSPMPLFDVEEAIAQKQVTEVGLAGRNPREVLEAIATIYGLRVRIVSDAPTKISRFILSLPKASTPRTAKELPEAVQTLFPQPLNRALSGSLVPIGGMMEEKSVFARAPKEIRDRFEKI